MIAGIDISHWQGFPDWGRIRASGVAFAAVKAFERTEDTSFAYNWAAMKAHGVRRLAYHFGRPGDDAAASARAFHATVAKRGLMPADGLVLDIETTDGRSWTTVRDWSRTFVAEVERLSGRMCGIYTARDFAAHIAHPDLARCPLWIADLSPTPHTPAGWPGWVIWQNGWYGRVPGISGDVDTDLVRSLADLDVLCAGHTTPTTTPVPSEEDDMPAPTYQPPGDNRVGVLTASGGLRRIKNPAQAYLLRQAGQITWPPNRAISVEDFDAMLEPEGA